MQRTEAEVVKNTWAILEEYERNPDSLKELTIGERVASRMLLRELKQLILPFTTSQVTASQVRFKSLEDFLRKCSRLLIGTPLLFCYQPKQWLNQSCIALAEELATVFPYSALRLLLPKVIIPENFETRHYNDFIVTEDAYLMGIVEGLDVVRGHDDRRFLHPQTGIELDPDLFMEHSSSAYDYATKIRNLFRPKQRDIDECDQSRDDLLQFLGEKNDYQRLKPAHKEAGAKRLMMALTKKVQTPQQLAEMMDANMLKEEWRAFLQAVGRDELCRIVIPKRSQSMQKKDQSDKEYRDEQATLAFPAMTELCGSLLAWPESDNAKRALVYLLVYLSYELRADGPEFYSVGRGWLSSMTGQTSRTDVLKQLQAMQDFLLSEDGAYQNMRDIDKYFADNGIVVASTTCTHLKAKIIDAARQCKQGADLLLASVAVPKQ